MSQGLSFQQVASSYKQNCKTFVDIANGKNISMTQTLHNSITDFSDREKFQHADVSKHILANDGLSVVSYGRNIASPVCDFKHAYQKNLLVDRWDDAYDGKLYRMPPMHLLQQFNEAGASLTGLSPGEAWRLWTDIQPKMAVLQADIPLTALVNFRVPSRSLAGRIPEIVIKRMDADPEDMDEGAPPKRGRVGFRKGSVEMQKAGILLELTKEFRENDDIGVDVVSMFFERVGVVDEIEIVSAMIKIAKDAAGAAKEKAGGGKYNMNDPRDILELQSVFGRGKRVDRVFGKKKPVLDYIHGVGKAYGSGQNTYGPAGGAAGGGRYIADPALINAQSRPTMAGYLVDGEGAGERDATNAGLTDDGELLLIDSMNTLGMLTYQGDPYEAENFDVVRAIHQHVLTRWWAGFNQVDAPIYLAEVEATGQYQGLPKKDVGGLKSPPFT